MKSIFTISGKSSRSCNLTEYDFEEYLLDLIDDLYYNYYAISSKVKISLYIEKFYFPFNKMLSCAFIVNELVGNALKHAFPGNNGGTIRVDLFKKCDNKYVLMVSDNGTGLPDTYNMNNIKSPGLDLVTLLAKELGGECEYLNDDGASFIITFPLDTQQNLDYQ